MILSGKLFLEARVSLRKGMNTADVYREHRSHRRRKFSKRCYKCTYLCDPCTLGIRERRSKIVQGIGLSGMSARVIESALPKPAFSPTDQQ